MADEAAPPARATPGRDALCSQLGIEFVYSADGTCLATLDAGPQACNIYGVVHGAVLFAMADTGMGFALLGALAAKPLLMSSISVTANYLRPAGPGRIEGHCSVLRQGRSVAFTACTVRDGRGSECAQFSGVFRIRFEKGEPQ